MEGDACFGLVLVLVVLDLVLVLVFLIYRRHRTPMVWIIVPVGGTADKV
jgi:hypothetical protein